MITKEQALEVLAQYKREHGAEFKIKRIGIFGSVARGDAREDSDVDVFIEIDEPTLFTMSGILQDLEARLGGQVDLVHYRARMRAYLKNQIERDAVYV